MANPGVKTIERPTQAPHGGASATPVGPRTHPKPDSKQGGWNPSVKTVDTLEALQLGYRAGYAGPSKADALPIR